MHSFCAIKFCSKNFVCIRNSAAMNKTVFVTVGSTSFDNLIKEIFSASALKVLQSKGYNKIVVQIGKGSFIPTENYILETVWYTYKKTILDDIRASDLIISHAGAGCILESLEEQKPLIVVVNEELMENHQLELASQLAAEKYLKFCNCSTLVDTLKAFSEEDLRTYIPSEPFMFPSFLDQVMGYA